MVQRKVPSKLSIQADDIKPKKRLGNLGPSSPRHQDGKNRGADQKKKKKMKKSRSIKRSDFESLRSPTFRREVPQPGKPPPPLHVPAATPQKQSPIKGSDSSPNYMKSTTSFDARKERSLVSSRSSQTSIDSKSLKKTSNSSKFSSGSSHKPAKTLTRTSSLKLVRTLTKSPSFKPARASTRKYSKVVLCENLDAQRATCSSTLKDSKFPTYLALSPGATESDGTSAMKVCPYTYCSLNGHHHAPLPPLKCFLSARRRALKNQKSMKLVCLSPRCVKPSVDGMKEVTKETSLDEKPAKNPLKQEDNMDFFVEIYVTDMEDAAEPTSGSEELDGGQVVESFSPCSEIDSENNLDEIKEVIPTKMDIVYQFFPEEEQNVYSPSSTKETPQCLSNESYLEVEGPASADLDDSDSETSDMEWEEGKYSAPSQTNYDSDGKSGSSFDDDNPSFHHEHIFKSDDIIGVYFDEIPAYEGLKEFFEEDGESSGAGCSDGSSDSEGSYQNLGSDESLQVFNHQHKDLVPPIDHVLEESTTEETDGNAESDDYVATELCLAPIGELIEAIEDENRVFETENENSIVDLQPGDDETESTIDIKDEALIDHRQKDESLEALLGCQRCDSSHNSSELHQDETYGDCSSSDNYTEVYQSDSVSEGVLVGSLLPETKDSETNQSQKQELPTADAGDGMEEKEQEDAAKSLIRIPTIDILQGLSEADQDITEEDNNEIQLGATTGVGESNQASASECLPAETQALHSSDKQSQSNNVIEDQNHSQKDCHQAQSFKILDSIDSEDQNYSGLNKVSVAENSNEVGEMEVDYSTMADTEESFPSAKNAASSQAKTAFFRSRSHSRGELPKAPNNLRIIRRKRPVEELEEARKFNPQEPNYLPIKPDPEAEKVDLKHQMMDEKKNAEEWMLDYALRQTVTKLAPARKRKVALLVEAFEKVMPMPKYESHLKHTSAAFAHARPIQACS